MKTAPDATYTLITNLDFVQVLHAGLQVRLDAHALLLENGTNGFFEPSYQVRGFGVVAEWPIFSLSLIRQSFPFSIADVADKSKIFIGADDQARPLFSGAMLRFAGSIDPSFFLQVADRDRPLDVQGFDATKDGEILKVWDALQRKVSDYWRFPGFPHVSYYNRGWPRRA